MATQYVLTSVPWTLAGVTGAVTATVTAPNGGESVQTLAATTTSPTGAPTVWFTPQTAGTYTLAWASTGGQTGTTSVVVDAAATPSSVMTIDDCYASLKINRTTAKQSDVVEADMLAYARAAVGVVESITGPVALATVTQVFDGGRGQVLLRARPRAILAVTAAGTPLGGWSCDFHAGILRASFPSGTRNIEVRYTVGSGSVPPHVLLGIREVFRQLWERSRGMGGASSPDMVLQGFAVPNAVYELLAPTNAFPGLA